ncbi:hypothetical protein BH10PSE12_BH10PSE12_17470 [soil metagenome]
MYVVRATYQPLELGEATNAALAFARHGQIADAFFAGQGPTAHLLPVAIWIAGSVYRLFGADSLTANLVLAGWALVQTFAAFLLLRSLFVAMRLDRDAVCGGLILLCWFPVLIAQEAIDFCVWEAGMAVCLAAINLLCLVRLADAATIVTWRHLAAIALLAAATAFVSPPAGLAVDCCWAIFAFRQLSWPRIAGFAALSAAALALLFVPWMLRNLAVLGDVVWIRSNFGLEFAIANHPAAVSGLSPNEVLQARMAQIHPFHNPPALAAMRAAGGEVAYAKALGRATWAWAANTPIAFIRLTLRHYRQFYVPDTWQLMLTNWHDLIGLRAIVMQIVGVSGLIALMLGLVRRRRHYGILATYIAVAGLPYALVQPIPRYSYLVYGLLAFLAVSLFVELAERLRAQILRQSYDLRRPPLIIAPVDPTPGPEGLGT